MKKSKISSGRGSMYYYDFFSRLYELNYFGFSGGFATWN